MEAAAATVTATVKTSSDPISSPKFSYLFKKYLRAYCVRPFVIFNDDIPIRRARNSFFIVSECAGGVSLS
jgi:hypothetical protein